MTLQMMELIKKLVEGFIHIEDGTYYVNDKDYTLWMARNRWFQLLFLHGQWITKRKSKC